MAMRTEFVLDPLLGGVEWKLPPTRYIPIEGMINGSSMQKLRDGLQACELASQPVAAVLINSPGGSVMDLMTMLSIMDDYRARMIVSTVAVGLVASAATVLFACGTKGYRYIDKSCNFMLHEVSSATQGKVPDMRSDVQLTEKLNEQIFKILAERSGKVDRDFYLQYINRTNKWMAPEEVLDVGIADYIGCPRLRFVVSVRIDYGLEEETDRDIVRLPPPSALTERFTRGQITAVERIAGRQRPVPLITLKGEVTPAGAALSTPAGAALSTTMISAAHDAQKRVVQATLASDWLRTERVVGRQYVALEPRT